MGKTRQVSEVSFILLKAATLRMVVGAVAEGTDREYCRKKDSRNSDKKSPPA